MSKILLYFSKQLELLPMFVKRDRIQRETGGVYSITLDSDDPRDRLQFRRWIKEDGLYLNGFSGRELAEFEPGFGTREARDLLKQRREADSALAELETLKSEALAAVEFARIALSQNGDPEVVETLFADLHKKQSAAELFRIKCEAGQTRIQTLKILLTELLENFRKQEFEQLRAPVDAAAGAFNAEVAQAYQRFWAVAQDRLPMLSEIAPDTFPGHVHFLSPCLILGVSTKLQQLQMMPQIKISPKFYQFELKEVPS
jgi:hypothetical protein